MANTKISDLPAVTDVLGTDEYVLARSGATKKIDADDLVAGLSAVANDGWVAAGDTWTYGSADDPTYTFTIAGVDRTSVLSPGMRVRVSQSTGGTKYGVITKVAFSTDTTVTIYMGTDYDLVNQTISSPYYSTAKAPFGFPLDPAGWTVTLSDTSDRTQSNPVAGTWYNLGSLSLDLPIGAWDVSFTGEMYYTRSTGTAFQQAVAISTSNATPSDSVLKWVMYNASASGGQNGFAIRGQLTLTSKTTYYVISQASIGGSGTWQISLLGTETATVVRARCAYL